MFLWRLNTCDERSKTLFVAVEINLVISTVLTPHLCLTKYVSASGVPDNVGFE